MAYLSKLRNRVRGRLVRFGKVLFQLRPVLGALLEDAGPSCCVGLGAKGVAVGADKGNGLDAD